MKEQAIDRYALRGDLYKAANTVLRFDSGAYFPNFVDNIWIHHTSESGLGNATAYIEQSPISILTGLSKVAASIGIHETNSKKSKWIEKLLKNKESIGDNKDLSTINSFLREFIPLYLDKIRTHAPPLGRYNLDTTLNNLFFYSLHFESRNVEQISDKLFNISPQEHLELTELYHEFIRSMFIDAPENHYSEKYPETVSDMLAFLGRFEADNGEHTITNDPLFKHTKNNLAVLRLKETDGNLDLTNSPYLAPSHPRISEKTLIDGIEHYLSYNHAKLPTETKTHLSSLLLSTLQECAVTTLETNYSQLKAEDKKIAPPPSHASSFITSSARLSFLNKLDILRPSSVELPKPAVLIEQFISKSNDAMTALDKDAKGYKRKLEKLEARLERFQNALKTVPASCELIVTPYTKRPSQESSKLRDDFNADAKKEFIKSTAMYHPISLLKHGLSIREVFWLARNGSIPASQKGILTIEHINDLAGGGFNEASGFCFMSSKLNNGKNDLIVPQTLDLEPGETTLIVTYAPQKTKKLDGKNMYPFIVGNFKAENENNPRYN